MQTILTLIPLITNLLPAIGAAAAAIASALAAYHGWQNGRSIAANHAEVMTKIKRGLIG